VAYPCSMLITRSALPVRVQVRSLLSYTIWTAVPVVSYLVFRVAYFHDWLPNTYVAKGGPRLAWLLDLILLQPWSSGRLAPLTESITGWHLVTWAPLLVVIALVSEPDSSYRRPMGIAATFVVLG